MFRGQWNDLKWRLSTVHYYGRTLLTRLQIYVTRVRRARQPSSALRAGIEYSTTFSKRTEQSELNEQSSYLAKTWDKWPQYTAVHSGANLTHYIAHGRDARLQQQFWTPPERIDWFTDHDLSIPYFKAWWWMCTRYRYQDATKCPHLELSLLYAAALFSTKRT